MLDRMSGAQPRCPCARAAADCCLASPIVQAEEEKKLHEIKMKKMEAEMNAVFLQKVQEKEAKLKQSEEEVGVPPSFVACPAVHVTRDVGGQCSCMLDTRR